MRILVAAVALTLPLTALAQDREPILSDTVEGHILPGFASLAETTGVLAQTAQTDCTQTSPELRGAYHAAFDDWISVSHLRFGPSERQDRAFALAYWPDPRGATPKSLSKLLYDRDTATGDLTAYQEVSIAARGLANRWWCMNRSPAKNS